MGTHQYAVWIGIVIHDLQGIARTDSFVVLWNSKNPTALCSSDWCEQRKLKMPSVSSLYSSFNLQGIPLLVMESIKLESLVTCC